MFDYLKINGKVIDHWTKSKIEKSNKTKSTALFSHQEVAGMFHHTITLT